MLMMRFKNYMARLMTENNICIFNIDTYLEPISTTLHGVLKDEFTEFGICLERFVVAGFRQPEDDATYREFKDLFSRQYAEVFASRGLNAAPRPRKVSCIAASRSVSGFLPHAGHDVKLRLDLRISTAYLKLPRLIRRIFDRHVGLRRIQSAQL